MLNDITVIAGILLVGIAILLLLTYGIERGDL